MPGRGEWIRVPSGRPRLPANAGRRKGPPGARGRPRKPGGIRLRRLGGDDFELDHPKCVREMELDYVERMEIWKAGDPEGARNRCGCARVRRQPLGPRRPRPDGARGVEGPSLAAATSATPSSSPSAPWLPGFPGRLAPRPTTPTARSMTPSRGSRPVTKPLGKPAEAASLRQLAAAGSKGRPPTPAAGTRPLRRRPIDEAPSRCTPRSRSAWKTGRPPTVYRPLRAESATFARRSV